MKGICFSCSTLARKIHGGPHAPKGCGGTEAAGRNRSGTPRTPGRLERRPDRTALQLFGAGDHAGDGGSRSRTGAGKIHFGFEAAHAAAEVAVGGGDATLAVAKNAHVASEAGAAGGRADDAAGIGKDVEQPFLHGLTPDGGRRGQDDTAHALGDLAALEHFGGVAHVGDAAVGAGADDHLIDGHVLHFGNGLGVFGQVRAGHLRLHVAHIDAYDSFIRRTGIGRNEFRIGAVVIAAIGERPGIVSP